MFLGFWKDNPVTSMDFNKLFRYTKQRTGGPSNDPGKV